MAYMEPRSESLTGMLGKVIDDIRELFREEVALARAELRQEVSAFSTAAIQFGIAAVAGMLALLFLLHSAALGAAALFGTSVWITYLGVAVVLGVVAAVTMQMARSKVRHTPAVPPQTVETLQENKEWLKHRMTSDRR